jgi:hypothetical protein
MKVILKLIPSLDLRTCASLYPLRHALYAIIGSHHFSDWSGHFSGCQPSVQKIMVNTSVREAFGTLTVVVDCGAEMAASA